jgi:predicted nucleic acid-binding protein
VNAEVLHAFRRLVNAEALTAERGHQAIELLATMALRRVGTTGLLARAWALRDNVTPYDAMYVALAERLACPLLTADRRLADSPGVDVPVILV